MKKHQSCSSFYVWFLWKDKKVLKNRVFLPRRICDKVFYNMSSIRIVKEEQGMKRRLFGIVVCTLLVSVSLPSIMAVPSYNSRWGPPYGPTEGFVGEELTFCIEVPDDPAWDDCLVMWDWGDGTTNYSSGHGGEESCASHAWNAPGDYIIKVKLENIHGNQSDWSDPLSIHISLGPVLEIGNITGFFLRIGVDISNTGDYNATNVSWAIYIQRWSPPKLFGKGTIPNLSPVVTEYVYKVKPVLCLGWFSIIVVVECQNAESIEKSVHAFAFIFLILYVES